MDMLPVAILAGGLATRMRPLTETLPKSLLPVAGRPFIDHQLHLLAAQGIRRVVLCVGHLGELIREHVGNGASFGLEVAFSWDGLRLLGTGGALKNALPLLGSGFFVLYGDSYLPCNFSEVRQSFERSGLPALMTVFRNENRWDTSNVQFEDGVIRAYSKEHITAGMRHIDYGLGVMTGEALARYAPPFDLATVYAELARHGRLAGHEVNERFYEIGSMNGLRETEEYLSRRAEGRA